MKVMLISAAVRGEDRYGVLEEVGAYLPPYGLCCLASVLEKEGHEVKILDSARYGLAQSEISMQIGNFKPDLVGISVYSIGASHAVKTAEAIKDEFGDIPIVVGGPHVTVYPDDLAQYSNLFDYLVVGEGEYTLLELAEAVSNGGDLNEIKGLYFRQNGKVVKNMPRPLMENLDELPFPAFHLIDNIESYTPQLLVYKKRPVITLVTSRGCPFACIFCNSVWTRKWRANSAEYVVDLVEYAIKKFNAKEINFQEDTFALKKERVLEICRLMKERNLDIIWTASVNLKTLNREVIRAMKDAGCWLVSCGIESGNDEVLKFIRKSINKETVKRVTGWLDEADIKIRGYFMMGHLTDTKETVEETVAFAKSLPLYTMNMSILYLSPGSQAREMADAYGVVDTSLGLGTGYPREDLSFVPNGLTKEYLSDRQKKAIQEFYFRPRQVVRLLSAIEGFEDIKRYAILTKTFMKLSYVRARSRIGKGIALSGGTSLFSRLWR